MNNETIKFITNHENDDVFTLKLEFGSNPHVDIDLAIRQIAGRQKVKHKVPLFYNNDDILYPAQLSLEQASSESTALYKSTICKGNSLVDLTGGFGIDCYFMSQQFNQATYVERQEELCDLANHNFKVLDSDQIKVIHSTTEEYLSSIDSVDWIFMDPARRSKGGKKVVLLSDCEPNVSILYPILLIKAAHIMVKLSPMMDISAVIRDLPNTNEVHIISVDNECKEVLLILNRSVEKNQRVVTINIRNNKENQLFEFKFKEEYTSEVAYAIKVGTYLYEPNAGIMKSGAFKLIGERFKLHKLHKNTHLYTSNELIAEFPGRIFEVKEQWGNSKKELKYLVDKIPIANISTRNYPLSADELRKKLKIKEGGVVYLFACILNNEQKVIIETNKVGVN